MRAFFVGSCLVVAACATSPDMVQPAYVSPLVYKDFSCVELRREYNRLDSEETSVAGDQGKRAFMDAATVGTAVFLPLTILFVGSSGPDQAAALASVRGQKQAVYSAGSDKECWEIVPAGAPTAVGTVTYEGKDKN